jgi:spermidine synthase
VEGGTHLLLDLEGCGRDRLNSPRAMAKLLHDVAAIMRVRVLKCSAHKFHPQGVTAFAVIGESHISVHTWPESGKAFLDVFTCRADADIERVLDFTLGAIRAKRGRVTVLLRDSSIGSSRVRRPPVWSLELDFGRPIFRAKSRFQEIELTRGPMGVSLFLDGYWQFVERHEHVYHEALVHPALVCAPSLRRVGIGGGGDGLALREVLRFRALGRAWLYELDPAMVHLAGEHPEMRRLNQGALDHPKACVVTTDAQEMLKCGAAFDALIFDFPSIGDGSRFGPLYGVPMYRLARKALRPGGILVTQGTDFPIHLRRMIRNLRRVFPFVVPMALARGMSQFCFVMASAHPFVQRRPLPPALRYLNQARLDVLLAGMALVEGDAPERFVRGAA